MSSTPSCIGRYQVVRRLGGGRRAQVYLASDAKLDRQVAIKVLDDADDGVRARFSSGAQSAARLQHPNIVTVYDVGEDDGRPYVAMEYIDGQTLAELIHHAS